MSAVLAGFFYKYTFKNPDWSPCVANASTFPAYGGGPEYTDVEYWFKVWFKWGFILNCVTILYSILAIIQLIVLNRWVAEIIAKLINVGAVLLCLSNIAWVITGTIFRWNHAGKVCSGDYVDQLTIDTYGKYAPYQWSSGQFIRIYLIIVFCFLGLVTCCLGLVICCACALK